MKSLRKDIMAALDGWPGPLRKDIRALLEEHGVCAEFRSGCSLLAEIDGRLRMKAAHCDPESGDHYYEQGLPMCACGLLTPTRQEGPTGLDLDRFGSGCSRCGWHSGRCTGGPCPECNMPTLLDTLDYFLDGDVRSAHFRYKAYWEGVMARMVKA